LYGAHMHAGASERLDLNFRIDTADALLFKMH